LYRSNRSCSYDTEIHINMLYVKQEIGYVRNFFICLGHSKDMSRVNLQNIIVVLQNMLNIKL